MSNNFRNIISVIFLLCGIAVIIVTGVLIIRQHKRASAIEEEIAKLKQQKEKYEHMNNDKMNEITYLKSKSYYEREAKKLNHKNPGERVVFIRNTSENSDKKEEENKTIKKDKTVKKHYQIWLNYFF